MDNGNLEMMKWITSEISVRDVKISRLEREKDDITALVAKYKSMYEEERERREKAEILAEVHMRENFVLRKYMLLSVDKVRGFFLMLRSVKYSALVHSFLVKCLPDNAPMNILQLIEEIAVLSDGGGGTVNNFGKDSNCFVAEGDVKDCNFGVKDKHETNE